MSRWRIAVVAILVAVPLLTFAGAGTFYLWWHGWSLIVWWPMMALFAVGWYLGVYWQAKGKLVESPPPPGEAYFTERDKAAALLVTARAEAGVKEHADRLADQVFYVETAQAMAVELAQFYHPGTKDAVDNLTVPEMITAVELAAEDLGELVEKYLPGGHWLRVRDFKMAQSAMQWWERGSNAFWGVMAVLDPINTALRYTASKVGIESPMKMLQANLTGWFYTAFVNRLGHYLIELNSGRLRVGARKFRELRDRMRGTGKPVEIGAREPADDVDRVTVTLIGQVKAGKSSLVNALIGEERARTSSLPATEGVHRYEAVTPGVPTALLINDTQGYGHEGPRADQLEKTFEAAKGSDLVLMVLHATNPGRAADVSVLERMRAWFAARPELRCPPIVAVVTHVDLLKPSLEWKPPYDWRAGTRPKEESMRSALDAVQGA
ncbi:MAG: 50S ribosome-binding GTPase, partial [Gemmataceae bacterium]|nr:50S ribosome-binding GTPase [Gemmataceae bacterium]